MIKLKTFVPTAVMALALPAGAKAQWRTSWSYEGPADGPERWGDLDPAYAVCKAGAEQSPIDIRGTQRADLPAIRFEYKSGPLKIVNNGYTAVRVNYAPGSGNFLALGGRRYELRQFHFHRPSEEYVNGKPYDMAIHFMHEDVDGRVAAVAVLLQPGRGNAAIEHLWQYMPKTPGPEQQVAGVEVNPGDLLPRNTAYYTYMGSLTAPPCTEGVTWVVLKTPLSVSGEEIGAFAKLYPHDVRPLQPLNGRIVKESH